MVSLTKSRQLPTRGFKISPPPRFRYFIIDGNQQHLWMGFAYSMLAVHCTVWPVAYVIKRLFDSKLLRPLNGIL